MYNINNREIGSPIHSRNLHRMLTSFPVSLDFPFFKLHMGDHGGFSIIVYYLPKYNNLSCYIARLFLWYNVGDSSLACNVCVFAWRNLLLLQI